MKVWKAELYLYKDNGWTVNFDFEKDDKEYEYNNDRTEFIHSEGWIIDRIPVNYRYENNMFGIKLSKGFTKELNEAELKDIKQEMKNFLFSCIQKEKEKVINEYDEKLNCLK